MLCGGSGGSCAGQAGVEFCGGLEGFFGGKERYPGSALCLFERTVNDQLRKTFRSIYFTFHLRTVYGD